MFDVCGKPRRLAADDDRVGPAGEDRLFETIAEHGHSLATGVGFALPEFEGGLHADGQGDRFGAGSQRGLLESAVQSRRELHAVAQEEHADPQRAVELVGGGGEGVDAECGEVDRQLADDLGGVGVEEHAVAAADRRGVGDWLQDARFVAGEHDASELRRRG